MSGSLAQDKEEAVALSARASEMARNTPSPPAPSVLRRCEAAGVQAVPASAATPPPSGSQSKTWIEIELFDDSGRPVAGEAYEATDAEGRRFSGVLDANGFARVAGVVAGDCKVGFPNLDRRAWR